MRKILCVDIGGTSIKHGVFLQNGEIFSEIQSVPTFTQTEDTILKGVKKIVAETLTDTVLDGVAISSAGIIDSETGTVVYSGYTIPNYTGTPLKKEIEATFGIPCEVENDVNAACLGEYWQGAGKEAQSLVCLTVGTGIGGALMLDGKLVHGNGNTAAEVGYMNIKGQRFQDIASTTSLLESINKKGSHHYENGQQVFKGAIEGDNNCIEAIDELVENLAIGIGNIMYLFNPEKIILGGGIMAQRDYLHDRINRSVEKQMIDPMFNKTTICFAENKNNAGMLGALYHFNKK